MVGGLTGAAFAAVAPAAGAGRTIGNRAAAPGVNFTSGFVSDLGSQHIHNAVNDGPDQDARLVPRDWWMMPAEFNPEQELRDRIAVIGLASEHFVGVGEIEHLLVDLLAFLKGGRIDRASAAQVLIGQIGHWPGAPEVLEFTMRDLRWPEVKAALEHYVATDVDFRIRDLGRGVLEVYEEQWPGGEIYRTYREA